MKLPAWLVLGVVLWGGKDPVVTQPKYFHYERRLEPIGGATPRNGPACAVLDGEVYAHSPTLADVRLFAGPQEVPYALSTSQTAPTSDAAKVLNAGLHDGHVVFDLAMPGRAYTDVTLGLNGKDFVLTAVVTGLRAPGDAAGTALGSFTLFDLSSTGLGRNTTLKLVESTFPYLHVDLSVAGAGGKPYPANAAMITGAEIPPSRLAQTIYTTVATTNTITQVGRHSLASFHVAAHVPVERVTFVLAPSEHANFSRSVSVLAKAVGTANGPQPEDAEARESVSGDITRIHLTDSGRDLQVEDLSVPATLGANMDEAADVQVWLENGDDRPLAFASVKLEMRQRLICFDPPTPEPPVLFYGDAKLEPPVYDYSRIFNPARSEVAYRLGPEMANPGYAARSEVDERSFMDRHPEVVWVALLGVVGVLGIVAFRSARRI